MKIERKYNFENLNTVQLYQIVCGKISCLLPYEGGEISTLPDLVITLRSYLHGFVDYPTTRDNRPKLRNASHHDYLKHVEKLETDPNYKRYFKHSKLLTDLLDNADQKYLGYKILDKKTEHIYTPREILELCAAAELETTNIS